MVDIHINTDLDIRWKQRFEYTVDLAWKVLKDKMEYDGINLSNISPKYVIKTAFNANYINTEEVGCWLEMIDARNDTAHDYDHKKFENIYDRIISVYFQLFSNFYNQYCLLMN